MSSTPTSASKLIPSDPSSLTVIRAVTPNITTLSTPFNRFGLAKIGGRCTIGKLLHSPRYPSHTHATPQSA